ncbi:MAG: YjgN family protein [Anderseniella sp.]|jgi:uncharacterized membrane protein YjgN (DUF898 family)|nr:YjgN family protein [Anderseniella sp.]
MPSSLPGHAPPPGSGAAFGPPGGSAGEPMRVEYVTQSGLGGIAITNFLLNLVTLWFYRFWAKTRVRRHVWSSVRVNGEPLEYTGTGKELFLGFLIIMGVIFLPLALIGVGLAAYLGPQSPALTLFQVVVSLVLVTLYGFAIYRARRYRLSRTVWRGIRGALTGSALAYSGKYFAALLLVPITLGWSRPAMNLLLAEQMYNDMRFGNQPFTFRGRAGPLYLQYAICWFLMAGIVFAIVIGGASLAFSGALEQYSGLLESLLDTENRSAEATGLVVFTFIAGFIVLFLAYQIISSIIWALYTAREMNLFAQYTSFPGVRFNFNATGWSLVTLWLGNLAIIIFTLGIAQPFVEQRVMRYFCDRLSVDGLVDFSAIRQSQAQLDKRGEGLIDALDLDAF